MHCKYQQLRTSKQKGYSSKENQKENEKKAASMRVFIPQSTERVPLTGNPLPAADHSRSPWNGSQTRSHVSWPP